MADKTYLGWPFFDDRHREFAAEFEVWCDAEIAPLDAAGEPENDAEMDALVRELVGRLGRGGWLKICVPAEYGGLGEKIDVRMLCLARDHLARHFGLAEYAFAMQGLGSAPISLYGSDAVKTAYLPGVADGTSIAAFAISEPGAGSDVAALAMTATRDGDDYVLDGTKTWISNAGLAGHYVTFARTGEAPGAKGLSAFVVDGGAAGLTVSERIPLIAPHPLGTLVFDNCRVPAANMLGRPGDGFKVAMATLDIFRSSVGASALGFARRAMDEAIGRAQGRKVSGKNLSEFQITQVKIADMAVKIDAAALLVYRAAWTKDCAAERVTREASMAKLFATDKAQEVIDEAVQIFGGLGVVRGQTVERLYREIRSLRIYEGTSEIQKLVIAAQTFAAAKDG